MRDNQRRHQRTSLSVEFRGKDAEAAGELVFEGADLSAGGTFLKSDLLLEEGEHLSLEFELPQLPVAIQVNARVAWVRRFPKGEEPAGMGVQFVDMRPEDRQALVVFLGTTSPQP